jgi:hypothetical protein
VVQYFPGTAGGSVTGGDNADRSLTSGIAGKVGAIDCEKSSAVAATLRNPARTRAFFKRDVVGLASNMVSLFI